MKKMGRNKRPFFRICAMDSRAPRDGKVLEELGHYDPLVKETDARAILNGERIAYWLSVGALPSENVAVLIKKYGKDGLRLAEQQAALERVKVNRPKAPAPYIPPPKPAAPEPVAEAPAAEAPPAEAAAAEGGAEAAAEQPAEAAG
jgi:small subunit ribosomal protein S16